jgi:hypothetical protein
MKRQFIQSSLTTSLITGALLVAAVFISTRWYTDRAVQADEPKAVLKGSADNGDGKATPAQNDLSKSTSQEELETKFEETLHGATLQGHFTNSRDEKGASPKEDKYTIESVKKLQGDIWLFTTRIQYEKHDVTLPLPLRVVWAGDTPVITLDRMPVPGMGSFTARVMIFDNQYAGMWDGGDHGGLLFGKIVKEAAKDH